MPRTEHIYWQNRFSSSASIWMCRIQLCCLQAMRFGSVTVVASVPAPVPTPVRGESIAFLPISVGFSGERCLLAIFAAVCIGGSEVNDLADSHFTQELYCLLNAKQTDLVMPKAFLGEAARSLHSPLSLSVVLPNLRLHTRRSCHNLRSAPLLSIDSCASCC